jgi:hypothetical protein
MQSVEDRPDSILKKLLNLIHIETQPIIDSYKCVCVHTCVSVRACVLVCVCVHASIMLRVCVLSVMRVRPLFPWPNRSRAKGVIRPGQGDQQGKPRPTNAWMQSSPTVVDHSNVAFQCQEKEEDKRGLSKTHNYWRETKSNNSNTPRFWLALETLVLRRPHLLSLTVDTVVSVPSVHLPVCPRVAPGSFTCLMRSYSNAAFSDSSKFTFRQPDESYKVCGTVGKRIEEILLCYRSMVQWTILVYLTRTCRGDYRHNQGGACPNTDDRNPCNEHTTQIERL